MFEKVIEFVDQNRIIDFMKRSSNRKPVDRLVQQDFEMISLCNIIIS